MKLRHAAALALVGRYLMVPPWSEQNHTVNFSASFKLWTYDGAFDTADDGQTAKFGEVKDLMAFPNDKVLTTRLKQIEAGQCIATDDPRLKLN